MIGGPGGPGGPKCTPCETTKLIYQAPHCATDDTPCTYPTSAPDVKVSMPPIEQMCEEEGPKEHTLTENQSEGSGEPEEVSEEEEVVSVPPLSAGSCVCVMPVRQPLEVGENEDCSQAVTPGTSGTCSCGGLDGDESGGKEKSESLKAERGLSLVSHTPPLLHTSSLNPPSSPLPELCLPLSQAQARPELKAHPGDRSVAKPGELYSLVSTDSSLKEDSTAFDETSVSSLIVSSSVGNLELDKPPEASSPRQGQGLSWGDGRGNKLSSVESDLECTPESLHSQLTEPTLTSGW